MLRLNNLSLSSSVLYLVAQALLVCTSGCARETEPSVKRIEAGQEFAGFLKDYSNLKPSPRFEGEALTFARADAQKTLRSYLAIMVDPVDTYLATDADEAKLPEKSRAAATRYFQWALTKAVSDAYPIVDEPGPLVLRLHAALIGVNVGGEVAAPDRPADPNEAIDNVVNIGKVGIEIELLDSETGEQIAAMVDRTTLGAGAEVASTNISKNEKSRAAREAFDEWASRVREFLDAEHELSEQDAQRADKSYQPYGAETATP
jgi:Protein of unknown function (DUF3313)